MKLISVVTPCYNEEENIEELYSEVKNIFSTLNDYAYEHIFIDNDSNDKTPLVLEEIAKKDKNVKVIFNSRNFGHIRSSYYGLLQAHGDAVIYLSADFQDPPIMIKDFIKKWKEGFKIAIGVKSESKEAAWLFGIRKLYYQLLRKLSSIDQIANFTGFGLYDKTFIDILRQLDESYPYFRGLITEIGFKRAEIEFIQPLRKKGKSKYSFYSLYDMAMLGFVSYSMVPLRIASFIGFVISLLSLLIAFIYTLYKIIFWNRFQVGIAPIVIGIFFFSAVQLFFIGMLGEYVGVIFTRVKKRPLVIERGRINFD